MCGIRQAYAVCCKWILFGLAISGVVLSCMSAASCHFLDFKSPDGTIGYAGLFRFHDPTTKSCIQYDQIQSFDESETAARWGATMAPLLAGSALLLCMFEFCLCRFPCSRLLIGAFFMAAQVMQGLTFLWLNSQRLCNGDIVNTMLHQDPCTPNQGSVFAIVALLCFFFCGVLVFCTPKPEPMKSRHQNGDIENSTAGGKIKDEDTGSVAIWTVDDKTSKRNDKASWA